MEHMLHKFYTKIWWIRTKPEITLIILKQIQSDIREYISNQLRDETSQMNLHPKLRPRRSWSAPDLATA
jgi:hypothetical protein